MKIVSLPVVVGGLLGMLVLPGAAEARFCASYTQISSNAGHCDNCRLDVVRKTRQEKYLVEANNGWYADVSWVEGDDREAEGGGRWDDVGGLYGNRPFKIRFVQRGRRLSMQMTTRGVQGHVEAEFRCDR